MANQQHLNILKKGTVPWNQWRREHPDTPPDLSGADLSRINLNGVNLMQADLNSVKLNSAQLVEADLKGATLILTDLSGANLRGAELKGATLILADFSGANLSNAQLNGANLYKADLTATDLTQANLSRTTLVEANLTGANLTNCRIYGISAWNMQLVGARQFNLIITLPDQPTITVDNLEVAQFIYLLLNNQRIRAVIDTITSKVVLILGRFTDERKKVLDVIRDELRKRGYVPVLFDFDKPESRDVTETVTTLARMARFVIADITDPKSIPQELAFIVPTLPSVPVQPLLESSQHEYGMFEHFTRFPWVLPVYPYKDQDSLLQSLKENVIDPAEKMARELAKR